MTDSILYTIKKMLGLDPDYEAFDIDVIIHINSALMVLMQIGVSNSSWFSITGPDETWSDFLGTSFDVEPVKSYVYLRVRRAFDPPANSFVADSIDRQISELEWRINVQVDKGVIYDEEPVDE